MHRTVPAVCFLSVGRGSVPARPVIGPTLSRCDGVVSMDGVTLGAMGVFVLLNWLHVAYFDRIQRWPTPWDRWARARPEMHGILKVLAIGFASVVTLVFVIMLAATAAG